MKFEYQILIIIFIHWLADFVFQTKEMGTKKSTDNFWLFAHVFIYSGTWYFVGLWFFSPFRVLMFTLTTFVFHFITDYLTSRWTKRLREKEKYYGFPSFFSVIGLDQVLHYVQLIICYEYFTTL